MKLYTPRVQDVVFILCRRVSSIWSRNIHSMMWCITALMAFLWPQFTTAAVESVPVSAKFTAFDRNTFTAIVPSFDAAGCQAGETLYCQNRGCIGYDPIKFSPYLLDINFMCFNRHSSIGSLYPVCPVPIVNPTVAYYFNRNTRMCERPAQDKLAIVLSGDANVEPWHKKHDPNHVKTNLPYKAIVTDQNGQAKANIGVSITTDVTANSGGHSHNANRPKGKLVATPEGTPSPVATKNWQATITGVTDSSGVFSFAFGAEEASGEHKLTATCPDCKAPATATVNVAVQGLTLLGADPASYNLLGATQSHPNNHYFSPDAMNKIINLAREFKKEFGDILKINDSSLVKGGVFDLGQDWTYAYNGHAGHRKGVVVDINNYRANSDPDFEVFTKKCCGIQSQWHKKGTAPHYHLLLLGRDE